MSEPQETQRRSIRIKKKYLVYAVLAAVVIAVVAYFIPSGMGLAFADTVAAGDNVSVFYTGSFTNGTVFGSNFNTTPFSFIAGSNQTIPGFSNAVIGMKVGQTKTVTLQPSEAYGEVNNSLIITVPVSRFSNSSNVSIGEIVTSSLNGATVSGVVLSKNSSDIVVDLNPPLAGKTLVFKIELLRILST